MQPKELLLTTSKLTFCLFHLSFPGLLAAINTIVRKGNLSPPELVANHTILYGVKCGMPVPANSFPVKPLPI